MDMIIEKEFREIVKTELAKRGWSQRELARQMEVDVSYVNQYLAGRVTPGTNVMERIFQTLGLVPHLSVSTADEKIQASA